MFTPLRRIFLLLRAPHTTLGSFLLFLPGAFGRYVLNLNPSMTSLPLDDSFKLTCTSILQHHQPRAFVNSL
jgi:hypothetical protein